MIVINAISVLSVYGFIIDYGLIERTLMFDIVLVRSILMLLIRMEFLYGVFLEASTEQWSCGECGEQSK